MTGQIGGLARVRSDVNEAAAQLARIWVGGWQKGDRQPLEAALAEIEAANEANKEVYSRAAAALKELSAKEAAFKAETEKMNAGLMQQAEGIAAASAKLNQDETALDEKRRAAEQELKSREDAITIREDAVSLREEAAEKAIADATWRANRCEEASQRAAQAEEEAKRTVADCRDKLRRTEAIWATQD